MVFRTSRRAVAQFVLTTGLFAVVATSCGTPSASSPDLTVNLPTTTVGVQQSGDGVVRIAVFAVDRAGCTNWHSDERRSSSRRERYQRSWRGARRTDRG